jgi:hypothetical protein
MMGEEQFGGMVARETTTTSLVQKKFERFEIFAVGLAGWGNSTTFSPLKREFSSVRATL